MIKLIVDTFAGIVDVILDGWYMGSIAYTKPVPSAPITDDAKLAAAIINAAVIISQAAGKRSGELIYVFGDPYAKSQTDGRRYYLSDTDYAELVRLSADIRTAAYRG
jgi:hypothetical protein